VWGTMTKKRSDAPKSPENRIIRRNSPRRIRLGKRRNRSNPLVLLGANCVKFIYIRRYDAPRTRAVVRARYYTRLVIIITVITFGVNGSGARVDAIIFQLVSEMEMKRREV